MPAPMRLDEPIRAAQVERLQLIDCRSRGRCLTIAGREDWNGFSCRNEDDSWCRRYQAATREDIEAERDGLITLTAAVITSMRTEGDL